MLHDQRGKDRQGQDIKIARKRWAEYISQEDKADEHK